jgi:hypothetical protein
MSDVKLLVEMSLVTVGDLIAIEDKSLKTMRNIVAKFMLGADGEYLPLDKAIEIINAMNMKEFAALAEKFANSMKEQSLPTIGDGQ